jgi:hypothetical protein
VSKWVDHRGHRGHGGFRNCAAVQAWLEFSGHFLNLLKIQTCFFNTPDEVYGNKDRL